MKMVEMPQRWRSGQLKPIDHEADNASKLPLPQR